VLRLLLPLQDKIKPMENIAISIVFEKGLQCNATLHLHLLDQIVHERAFKQNRKSFEDNAFLLNGV
jgi:hypothetical protein